MRILFIVSEISPYSKTGGLGDVGGALPAALEAAGHELMVVTPLYRQTREGGHMLYPEPDLADINVQMGPRTAAFSVWRAPDQRTWFIDLPQLYDRPLIYTADPDEYLRFLLLTRAAIELVTRIEWAPDILHCNDWQTALAPLLMRSHYAANPFLANTRSVLTIHNLGYQGVFSSEIAPVLGLGDQQYLLHQDHLREGYINFLEHGILYADALTTVSPTYAWEIQTPEWGAGLDRLLRLRSHDLVGILNGIDTSVWSPRTDKRLPFRYSEKSLWRKEKDKEALMARVALPYEKGTPVAGLITRLTRQKGIDILLRPIAARLEHGDMRFVALGSGERVYEQGLSRLRDDHPDRAAFHNGYDEDLAHLIEAGADLFLMPSIYEPCGLNQMYSLAYGTAPVVRKTGGLADTVTHYDPITGEGNGFVFEHYTEQGLAWALDQALTIYRDRRAWQQLQHNAMAADNSWDQRSIEYGALYKRLTEGGQT
jgi:starch synthase